MDAWRWEETLGGSGVGVVESLLLRFARKRKKRFKALIEIYKKKNNIYIYIYGLFGTSMGEWNSFMLSINQTGIRILGKSQRLLLRCRCGMIGSKPGSEVNKY